MTGLLVVTSATSRAVKLGGDGVSNVGKLLELLIEVLSAGLCGVLVEPVLGLLDGLEKRLLVIVLNLATKTLLVVDLVLEAVGVVLELVARLNALAVGLVLLGILLSLLNHTLNVLGGKATLVVGDSDALTLTGALVNGADLQNTVGIELESDLDLGNTTGSGAAKLLATYSEQHGTGCNLRNVGELELAEIVAVNMS